MTDSLLRATANVTLLLTSVKAKGTIRAMRIVPFSLGTQNFVGQQGCTVDFDQWMRETKPYTSKRKVRVLTEEGEKLAEDYRAGNGCSCHLGGAPCSHCTHPGNPDDLHETPDMWTEIEVCDE